MFFGIDHLLEHISLYGVFGVLGVLSGFLYLIVVSRIRNRSYDDLVFVYVWSVVSAMIGAKILYLLVSIPAIIRTVREIGFSYRIVLSYLQGGFVFYGGLIGAVIGAMLAMRYFRMNLSETSDALCPLLPLVHGFGRLGCTAVGCCYGMQVHHSFSVIYTNSRFAPNGVRLFPVQPMEAALEFILFFVLSTAYLKFRKQNLLYFYLVVYGIARFILEFFRDDAERGSFLVFSTSQWISILILIAVTVLLLRKRRKQP